MSRIPTICAVSLKEVNNALERYDEVLIITLPLDEIHRQLSTVRAGVFDFDGTLVSTSHWNLLDRHLSQEGLFSYPSRVTTCSVKERNFS